MPRFEVGVSFTSSPGTKSMLQHALDALKGFDVEAPTAEAAEHYAHLIVRALEDATETG